MMDSPAVHTGTASEQFLHSNRTLILVYTVQEQQKGSKNLSCTVWTYPKGRISWFSGGGGYGILKKIFLSSKSKLPLHKFIKEFQKNTLAPYKFHSPEAPPLRELTGASLKDHLKPRKARTVHLITYRQAGLTKIPHAQNLQRQLLKDFIIVKVVKFCNVIVT